MWSGYRPLTYALAACPALYAGCAAKLTASTSGQPATRCRVRVACIRQTKKPAVLLTMGFAVVASGIIHLRRCLPIVATGRGVSRTAGPRFLLRPHCITRPADSSTNSQTVLLSPLVREVQPLRCLFLGTLAAPVVTGCGRHVGVSHQLLHCRDVYPGVKHIARKGAPHVMG